MEEYKGFTIAVENDQDAESPRDWDNLGTMICFHKRYSLGDEHSFSVEEAKKMANLDSIIALPLYLYDHSGLTISTKSFFYSWDSGQIGFIFVEKEKVRKEFKYKIISKKLKERILSLLEEEVEVYDQYLKGDIFYYKISKDGEEIDSLYDIYGFENAVKMAKEYIDKYIEDLNYFGKD